MSRVGVWVSANLDDRLHLWRTCACLREQGLARLTDAPELPLAGTAAYAAAQPWVLLEDGRLARL